MAQDWPLFFMRPISNHISPQELLKAFSLFLNGLVQFRYARKSNSGKSLLSGLERLLHVSSLVCEKAKWDGTSKEIWFIILWIVGRLTQQTVVENTYEYLFRLLPRVNGLTVKNTFLASKHQIYSKYLGGRYENASRKSKTIPDHCCLHSFIYLMT